MFSDGLSSESRDTRAAMSENITGGGVACGKGAKVVRELRARDRALVRALVHFGVAAATDRDVLTHRGVDDPGALAHQSHPPVLRNKGI